MLAALSVSGSQQLRLLRTHPRVAILQHNKTVLVESFQALLKQHIFFRRSIV